MKRYTDSHEWAEKRGDVVRGDSVRCGITSYAQGELGEIVYVSLPAIGTAVRAGEEAVVLESTKAASDVYSPLSGTITAVNTKVAEDPRLLNDSPEGDGWLFELAPSLSAEWESLLTDRAYGEMVSVSS